MKENHLFGTHLHLKIIHLGLFISLLRQKEGGEIVPFR